MSLKSSHITQNLVGAADLENHVAKAPPPAPIDPKLLDEVNFKIEENTVEVDNVKDVVKTVIEMVKILQAQKI